MQGKWLNKKTRKETYRKPAEQFQTKHAKKIHTLQIVSPKGHDSNV